MKLPRAKPAPAPLNDGEAVVGLASGLRALVARNFLHSVKHQEQHLRANRDGAHEKILLLEKKFLAKMQKQGIPMYAHCIVRDEAEQTRAFVQGFSKARFGESAHNYGMAVDFIHGVKAWDLPTESWLMIGHIAKEICAQSGIPIVWGGDWKKPGQKLGWDPAHFELKNWRALLPDSNSM